MVLIKILRESEIFDLDLHSNINRRKFLHTCYMTNVLIMHLNPEHTMEYYSVSVSCGAVENNDWHH